MIEEYLNFSEKINILSNKIPILKDLKLHVWKYYKKYSYANQINNQIKKYLVKMNTEINCNDCGKKVKYKNLIKTYCNAEGFWYGYSDENKYICKEGCEFKLDCGCSFKSKYYNHVNKHLKCFCDNCNKKYKNALDCVNKIN